MAAFLGNVEWVGELIPDLKARIEPFTVDTEEVDEELAEVFIEEIRRLATELREGLARRDGSAVRMAAHSIKGMGGTVGLPEISVLGQEIEAMAKEERLADALPLVDGLVGWMDSLR